MPSLMRARSGILSPNAGGNALAPLFSTGALTIANAITDVTRLAGVEGDGAAYPDSSVGVWPEATNLITNGGFETNTTGWVSKAGGETLARVTTTSKFGSACAQITLAGLLSYEGLAGIQNLALVNGTVYTAGAWVWCETGTLNLRIRVVNASVPIGTTTFVATTTPQRVSVTVTATADTPFRVEILTDGAQTGKFWVDGVSCYARAIDMPYIETDGGTASRSAGRIQMPASVLDETQGWVRLRVRHGAASTAGSNRAYFAWADDNSNYLLLLYDVGNARWSFRRTALGSVTGGVFNDTFAIGDVSTLVFAWTATAVKMSVDGSAFTSAATTTIPTLTGSVEIGAYLTGSHAAATYLNAECGKGTLTDADAALFHAWGNNDPLPHQFPRSAQLSFLAHFNNDGTFYRRSA